MDAFRHKEKRWLADNPLKQWRSDNNAFQKDLGAAIGVGYHTIFRWESGMSMPTEKQFELLSTLFKDKDIRKKYQNWVDARPILGREE